MKFYANIGAISVIFLESEKERIHLLKNLNGGPIKGKKDRHPRLAHHFSSYFYR